MHNIYIYIYICRPIIHATPLCVPSSGFLGFAGLWARTCHSSYTCVTCNCSRMGSPYACESVQCNPQHGGEHNTPVTEGHTALSESSLAETSYTRASPYLAPTGKIGIAAGFPSPAPATPKGELSEPPPLTSRRCSPNIFFAHSRSISPLQEHHTTCTSYPGTRKEEDNDRESATLSIADLQSVVGD